MPSIEENLDRWNESYDWRLAGEAWSKPWGGATAQWYGCIYPRIQHFLPAASILEIAPGFGRWTEFLLESCDTLIGVDVTPKCIEACRERFADRPGARFEVNDGVTLPMVADASTDFAFSFDSLVHVEIEVLSGYLDELARVLTSEGVAFLHHSNYGTYQRSARALAPLQSSLDRLPVPAAGRAAAHRRLPGCALAGLECHRRPGGGSVRAQGPALRRPRTDQLGGWDPTPGLSVGDHQGRFPLGSPQHRGEEPTLPVGGPGHTALVVGLQRPGRTAPIGLKSGEISRPRQPPPMCHRRGAAAVCAGPRTSPPFAPGSGSCAR